MAMHIGQSTLNAIAVKCESFMIDAQQVKHGGMEIVLRNGILYRLITNLSRGAVGHEVNGDRHEWH